MSSLSGVILGTFHEPTLIIDLPLVTEGTIIKQGRKIIERKTRTFGEACLTGDFHYGHSVFSEPVMHGYLNFLRDHKNIQIGLMGDIIECGALTNFITEEDKPDIDDQISSFCSDWRLLADRVKFSLWGNHEEREAKSAKSKRFLKTIMNELGVKDDCKIGEPQRGMFVVFKAGEQMYGCYFSHSKTNARVNQDIQLQRTGSQNLVTLIGHGHTHRLAWKPRTFFEMNDNNGVINTTVRRQYLLATGCFLEYPSYAEASSMPLTEVGAPIVRFYADNNELDCYDLTRRYHSYIKYDSAGAGAESFEHDNRNLSRSFKPLPPPRQIGSGGLDPEALEISKRRQTN